MLRKARIFQWFILSICFCVANSSFGQSLKEEELWKKASLSLKEALQNPRKTQALYLHDTTLTVFPSEILKLKNLKLLNISESKVSTIPDALPSLKKLQFLYLNKNENLNIASILKSIKDTNISKLVLTNCQLTELPSTIGEIGKLNELYLYNNQLKSLPQEIGSLQNLKVLLVENNLLTDLPSSIENLSHLNTLSINGNSFNELPMTVSQLSSLRSIYVGNKEMDVGQMFDVLGNCNSLRFIHISQINLGEGKGKNIKQLLNINGLEQVILEDVFLSFEEIPLDVLGQFDSKITIKTRLDFTEDQLDKICSFQNISFMDSNNSY